MSDKVKTISICFENCDSVDLGIEYEPQALLDVTGEHYFASMYIFGEQNQYANNNLSVIKVADKYARIQFDKSALNVESRHSNENFKTTLGTYLPNKDITHIDIVMEDGKNYYIAVPWRPINALIDTYNLYQIEKIYDEMVEITFERKNFWLNLPKGIWWYFSRKIGWWLHQQRVKRKGKKVH